jgi:Phosphotransferase enzyme family
MSPGSLDETGIELWRSQLWLKTATSWLDEQLAGAGIRRTGAVEQPHLRPWATVLKAPTTAGTVWLKANGPGTAFEAGLYELLARVAPARVLVPIAVDVTRGWVAMPDGGPPLADRVAGADLACALAAILPRYGELQRDFAPEAERALALGVADMRAERMPGRFEEALDVVGGYLRRYGDTADNEALRRVAAIGERYRSWCARLAAAPGPPSLDHNDLHTWNMLVTNPGRPDEVRFYDWGDAVVAHPFATMLVALGWAQRQLKVDLYAAELVRIRDAYLEPFSDLASRDELVEALELACRVGKVARALTWARAVTQSDPDELDNHYAAAPLQCLRSLLDDSYLGGA